MARKKSVTDKFVALLQEATETDKQVFRTLLQYLEPTKPAPYKRAAKSKAEPKAEQANA
ncbi:MAG: hypothetical protein U1E51_06585 [Candidatus Binatia bacterium]|nr:hypothetical protein [Candidatus Binatia bacterium]